MRGKRASGSRVGFALYPRESRYSNTHRVPDLPRGNDCLGLRKEFAGDSPTPPVSLRWLPAGVEQDTGDLGHGSPCPIFAGLPRASSSCSSGSLSPGLSPLARFGGSASPYQSAPAPVSFATVPPLRQPFGIR